MSNPNANKLQHNTGTANAQPITFFAGAFEFSTTRFVTLTANYARTPPPHYPDANPGVGRIGTSLTQGAQTIPAGTRLQLYSAEAAALVAAGAGVYS